jgi:hypothetical protein
LSAAEAAGFDVRIMADRSIPAQQNFPTAKSEWLFLIAGTNRLRDLVPIPAVLAVLNEIQPGRVEIVS